MTMELTRKMRPTHPGEELEDEIGIDVRIDQIEIELTKGERNRGEVIRPNQPSQILQPFSFGALSLIEGIGFPISRLSTRSGAVAGAFLICNNGTHRKSLIRSLWILPKDCSSRFN